MEKWLAFQVSSGLNQITDKDRTREAKRAALLAALSYDTIRWVQSNSNLTEEQKTNADQVVKELKNFIHRLVNPVVNTIKMLQRKQHTSESIEDFTMDLQEMVKACNLEDVKDTKEWFLKICLILNIENTEIRAKLMLEPDLSYNNSKALCIAEENASKHSRQILNPSNPEVNKISKYRNAKKHSKKMKSKTEEERKTETLKVKN
jgi:hypothetical protein